MSLKMKQLPETERPYEKLQMYGEKKLSNAELLAIIIKTGTKEETAVSLANRILVLVNNISELQNLSLEELIKIKGIGKVKAIQIKATCELASRMNVPLEMLNKQINSSKDVAELVINELKNERIELLKLIMIDTKNRLTKIVNIKEGSTSEINITPTRIMQEVIKSQAPKFILVHNHPSGDTTPSKADIEFTKRIQICAKLLDVRLVDHIIIGADNYRSIIKLIDVNKVL